MSGDKPKTLINRNRYTMQPKINAKTKLFVPAN